MDDSVGINNILLVGYGDLLQHWPTVVDAKTINGGGCYITGILILKV